MLCAISIIIHLYYIKCFDDDGITVFGVVKKYYDVYKSSRTIEVCASNDFFFEDHILFGGGHYTIMIYNIMCANNCDKIIISYLYVIMECTIWLWSSIVHLYVFNVKVLFYNYYCTSKIIINETFCSEPFVKARRLKWHNDAHAYSKLPLEELNK